MASPKTPKSKPAAGTTKTVPAEVAIAFKARNDLGSGCNWIFEVDYSINSKYPRLFIYSVTTGAFYKYKCGHGRGGANEKPHDGKCREVSNKSASYCSSLGIIRTGVPYQSETIGQGLRLKGLSPTNSNILARGVVLHGSSYVFDNETSTDTTISGRSLGCIVVDDKYINFDTGGELIEWLRDGSIGVAHYDGSFTI